MIQGGNSYLSVSGVNIPALSYCRMAVDRGGPRPTCVRSCESVTSGRGPGPL